MAGIYRLQYRARLHAAPGEENQIEIERAKEQAERAVTDGKLLTIGLYPWGRQLYLYMEAIGEKADPEKLLSGLYDALDTWPEGEEDRKWVYMTPVFYHDEPKDVEDWMRKMPGKRVGRIAHLLDGMVMDYVYHHLNLVREGLLQGDRYQFISLHEDMLFSYFEEPRTHVNIRHDTQTPSKAIEGWMQANPEAHFEQLPGANGQNFRVLEPLFTFGRNS